MEDEYRRLHIDRNDLEFVREIAGMSVHRKILLQGILVGLTMAEQGREKDRVEAEYYH